MGIGLRYSAGHGRSRGGSPHLRELLMEDDRALPEIDITRAHPARIYDAWLGGKDNFAGDREAAELALQAYPALGEAIRSNRAFLGRAVRFLASAGIRQFLDIGTG